MNFSCAGFWKGFFGEDSPGFSFGVFSKPNDMNIVWQGMFTYNGLLGQWLNSLNFLGLHI